MYFDTKLHFEHIMGLELSMKDVLHMPVKELFLSVCLEK